ncbi:baculoviral IAP repeat-containing protein 2-like isoform X2 [Argopecten irradians]|uniref:baculoviral IAP repeat-containing protein 2-like isoform X2 n=1 Tax=Argopecten irradians TaxID=31199 RepID=UPI0037104619
MDSMEDFVFQKKNDGKSCKHVSGRRIYLSGFLGVRLYVDVFMLPYNRPNVIPETATNPTIGAEGENRTETLGATSSRLSINETPPITDNRDDNNFEQITAGTVTQSMRFEWARFKSFWSFPLSCPIAPTALAKSGFYYTGNEDNVCCFCCGVSHGNWQKGESVYTVHYTISKTCRFMRGDDVGNVPIHGPNSTLNQRFGIEETTLTSEERELTSLLHTPDNLTSILMGRERDRGNPASLPQVIHSAPDLRETTPNRFGGDSRQNATDIRNALRGASNLPTTQTSSASSSECLANTPKPVTPSVPSQTTTQTSNVSDLQRTSAAPNVSAVTLSEVSQPNDVAIQSQTDTTGNQQRTPSTRQHHRQQQNQQRQGVGGADNGNLGVNTTRPRYPNYAVLTVRSSTFHGFPNHLDQTPIQMAKAGFFYAGYGDYVRCFYCGGCLRNWEPGDDPWVEHARWFPRCVYVKQNKGQAFINMVQRKRDLIEDNKPKLDVYANQQMSPNQYHPSKLSQRQRQQEQQQRRPEEGTDNNLVVNEASPQFPGYASITERRNSFNCSHMSRVARQMATAGFFYAGFGDHVSCFFCGGYLRNWNLEEDDPWVEHARCYPNCAYVKENKGQPFINRVLRGERELTLPNEYLCTTPGASITTSTSSVQTARIMDRQASAITDTTLVNVPTTTIHRQTERSVTAKDMSSTAVRSIREMGYTEEVIRMTIQQLRRNLGKTN